MYIVIHGIAKTHVGLTRPKGPGEWMFARWYDYEIGFDWQTHSDFQIFEKQTKLYANPH